MKIERQLLKPKLIQIFYQWIVIKMMIAVMILLSALLFQQPAFLNKSFNLLYIIAFPLFYVLFLNYANRPAILILSEIENSEALNQDLAKVLNLQKHKLAEQDNNSATYVPINAFNRFFSHIFVDDIKIVQEKEKLFIYSRNNRLNTIEFSLKRILKAGKNYS